MPPEEQIETQIEEAGTTIEIKPDPPPGDDAPATAGGERPSRRERNDSKRQGWDAEAREARAETAAARAHAQQLEVQMAELRGRVTAGEAARTAAQGDPDEAALAEAQNRESEAVSRMGRGDAAAEADWKKAKIDAARIIARQVAREEGTAVEKRIQGSMPKPMDPQTAALVAEFPWLASNPKARRAAERHAERLEDEEDRDMKNPAIRHATLREAATLAARDLKLGGAAVGPTDLERGRIAGTRSGDSGAGPTVVKVHMSKSQMQLAEDTFRSLPKEEAHTKWWKEIGSKIQKAK